MKYNDDEELYVYQMPQEELEKKNSKIFDVFVRLIAGGSVSTVLFTIANIIGFPFALPTGLVCLALGVPTTYIGLTKMKQRTHDIYVRDMHVFEQFQRGIKEFNNDGTLDDKTVTDNMTVFYSFIAKKDLEEKIPQSEYNAINSLLFMINENYYEKIATDSYSKLSRTTLIEMMVQIILSELKEDERFDEYVAEDVINRAFFIKDSVKKEMIKEFRKSKHKVPGTETMYKIISSKVSLQQIETMLRNNKEDEEITTSDDYGFNINRIRDYKLMLEEFSHHELNEYGDFTKVDIDLELFKNIIIFIDDLYTEQLSGLYENYSIESLAASLLYNVGVYCLINKKQKAGMQEILNTMKEWHYLDYDDKLIIIGGIYQEFDDMDNIIHPYSNSEYIPKPKEETPHCKIIQFPGPKR